MAWIISDDVIGLPRIGVPFNLPTVSQPSPNQPENGRRVHAVERSIPLGGGEFIFLGPAPSAIPVGTLVTYDTLNATITIGAAASSGAPVAFASCALATGQYGWFQTCGAINNAVKDGTALVAGGPVGVGTVAGSVGLTVATKALLNARSLNAAAAGNATATIYVNDACNAQS